MPTLPDLAAFAAVARRASFSRAAVELGVTQPAVSQAVARLERELGVRLVHRTSRTVELTEAGRTLLGPAEAVLDQVAAFTAEAARWSTTEPSGIRLAYAPLVGTLAARTARRLSQRKPAVAVDLVPLGGTAAAEALQRAEVAAALLHTPFPPGFASTARFRVPVTHLAVPAASALATSTGVRPAQLFQHELLIPQPLWPRASRTVEHPRLVAVGDDVSAGLDLVAAGRGLLPVPRLTADTVRRPDLAFVRLDGVDLAFTFGLAWSPERAGPEVVALVQAVQEMLRTI
ncbi:LysR family transcriptional regulator [Hamadaea tsunoensis]|uniref:LysR family transcriptional regulator n=1 Tax=Hamadaea tsunoensis TaxID=53368 RepID=UPI000412D3E5|nr:LysR family transcriptional regulator [Hamadaea tsunoensis]